MKEHELKGFLSFLILWMINQGKNTGAEISRELHRRKGTKPSPGTIYPALKELQKKGLIKSKKDKTYTLTPKGKKTLTESLNSFFSIFCDLEDMKSCCPKQ